MSEPAATVAHGAIDAATLGELKAFLYREAGLADASDYDGWEALVTDDMHYWVPRGPADYDPAEGLSYINDNRPRLATRLRQLRSGSRWAQVPHSPMRRLLSNIEVLAADSAAGPYTVAANFVVYELAAQSTGALHLWPGRATYRLRREHGQLRMAQKIVELVTARRPLPNLAFLL
jgi:3-phenylpropionate/cinnamic acid dioxygenase small subunit